MKRYIGDAVYVDFDGFALVLTTEDGISVSNKIIIEPHVWEALKEYVAHLISSSRPAEPPTPPSGASGAGDGSRRTQPAESRRRAKAIRERLEKGKTDGEV